MIAARSRRVIVTRPAAQAAQWVERLQSRGVDAVALPLIVIAPIADPRPLAAAWRSLAQRRLVVFVSANAVAHFFAARPADASWPEATLAAAPGRGTAEALRAHGVAAARIVEPAADAAQLDSEALWSRLCDRDWQQASVLVVRGDGGREWLAEQLVAAGAAVDAIAAYRRQPPTFSAADEHLIEAAARDGERFVWLFSSAEAIGHLVAAAPARAWQEAGAIATHPRIAERARQAGFGHVVEASPSLDSIVACIQSPGP